MTWRIVVPTKERLRAAMEELAQRSPDGALGSQADRIAWWAIEELVKQERQRGAFSQALRLLVDGAALPFDRERSITLSYQAAEIAVEALHDPDLGAEICRSLLAKAPDHPWAIHLYIHLVEASDRPERAEPYADRLAALMPGAGHIVHMPSHIYHRLGRYLDSLEANRAASSVDEKYIAQTGAMGVYPVGYYSHNVHFVLISAQQLGDRDTLVISYNVNSFEGADLYEDARLYRPRYLNAHF